MINRNTQPNRRTLTTLAVMALAMVVGTAAQAIVVPPSLNPGAQYRLAFVTQGTRDAISTDIADYNTFVNDQAALSPLTSGVGWFAIGSTAAVDARDNTNTNPTTADPSVPIFLVDGTTKIADDNADLWDGQILAPLRLTQFSAQVGFESPFTGTGGDGTATMYPLGSTNPDGVEVGTTDLFGGIFSWITLSTLDSDALLRVYALSETITVANTTTRVIPEPLTATLGLMGLGLLGMATRRRVGVNLCRSGFAGHE